MHVQETFSGMFISLSLWERARVREPRLAELRPANPHPNPLPRAGEGENGFIAQKAV